MVAKFLTLAQFPCSRRAICTCLFRVCSSQPAPVRAETQGMPEQIVAGHLRGQRLHVGPNDLWIAAAAVGRNLPLLTRNVKELSRVEGLQVVDYAVG